MTREEKMAIGDVAARSAEGASQNALSVLRKANRKAVFPGDGLQVSHSSHMSLKSHEKGHVFQGFNNDISFWSELQRIRVWPTGS